jgi:ribosomal protein S18 acetylase RimI-like enzyme
MPPATPVPHIAIRPFVPDDFAHVAALTIELQEFERGVTPYRVPADEEFAAWYVARLLRWLEQAGGTLLVATEGGAPCGYAAGHPEDEPEMRDRFFYVAELVVAASHRGRGIGTRLIAAMEDLARAQGLGRIGIGVLAGSDRVHALYRRLGYRDYAVSLRKQL